MVPKHVVFAPAIQKQPGSRLRSPLPRGGTVLVHPFSRFFHHTDFAKQGEEIGDSLQFLCYNREKIFWIRTTWKARYSKY